MKSQEKKFVEYKTGKVLGYFYLLAGSAAFLFGSADMLWLVHGGAILMGYGARAIFYKEGRYVSK